MVTFLKQSYSLPGRDFNGNLNVGSRERQRKGKLRLSLSSWKHNRSDVETVTWPVPCVSAPKFPCTFLGPSFQVRNFLSGLTGQTFKYSLPQWVPVDLCLMMFALCLLGAFEIFAGFPYWKAVLELRVISGGGGAKQKSTVSLSSVSHIVQMFPENSNGFLGKVPTEAVLTLYPCSPIHVSFFQCGHVLAQAWLMNRGGYSWGFVFEAIHCAHDAVFNLERAPSLVTRASCGVYLGVRK